MIDPLDAALLTAQPVRDRDLDSAPLRRSVGVLGSEARAATEQSAGRQQNWHRLMKWRLGRQADLPSRDHETEILGYLARRTHRPLDAVDLLSEVLAIEWRTTRSSAAQVRQDQLRLFEIARGVLTSHQHDAPARSEARDLAADEVRTATEARAGIDHDQLLNVRLALDTLDPIDKEILTLSVWEDLTPAEIGQVLRLPAESVRSRLRRARTRLRRDLALDESASEPAEFRAT